VQIRNDQMNAFSDSSEREYINRLIRFLRDQYPQAAAAPDSELRTAVETQVAMARSYGLTTEHDVAVYVNTAFLLGEEFDTEYPAAQEVLPSPVLASSEKAAWLSSWTREMFDSLEPPPPPAQEPR
jgi:hypothetical protein